MRKCAVILSLLLFLITFFIPKRVEALDCSFSTDPDPIYINTGNYTDQIKFTFNYKKDDFSQALSTSQLGGNLLINLSDINSGIVVQRDMGKISSRNDVNKFASNQTISLTYDKGGQPAPLWRGDHQAWIEYRDGNGKPIPICDKQAYSVIDKPSSCTIIAGHDKNGDVDSNFWVTVSDIKIPKNYGLLDFVFDFNLNDSQSRSPVEPPHDLRVDIPKNFAFNNTNPPVDKEHTVQVYPRNSMTKTGTIPRGEEMCRTTFKVAPAGATPIPNTPTPPPTLAPTPTKPPDYCNDEISCIDTENARLLCNVKTSTIDCSKCSYCQPTLGPTRRPTPKIQIPNLKPLCDQLDDKYKSDCWVCQQKGEIWSAIGCLPTDFSALVNKYVFTTGVGLAGGIAFIYFLYGAFLILTSSGNAEKMEEAKQIITSSLAGLILIIFSVFLLKTIGVDILKLPGFG